MGNLDAHGYVVKIGKGFIKVIKEALNIMRGSMMNGLYVLDKETHLGTTSNVVSKYISNPKL